MPTEITILNTNCMLAFYFKNIFLHVAWIYNQYTYIPKRLQIFGYPNRNSELIKENLITGM